MSQNNLKKLFVHDQPSTLIEILERRYIFKNLVEEDMKKSGIKGKGMTTTNNNNIFSLCGVPENVLPHEFLSLQNARVFQAGKMLE